MDYDKLLAGYFSGTLNDQEKQAIEKWAEESEKNRYTFKSAGKVWQSVELLREMKGYDTPAALNNVNRKIAAAPSEKTGGFLFYWQRIAAILLLPVLLAAGAYFFTGRNKGVNSVVWQTITTPPGIKSKTQLPDGTQVWLNSGSSLQFPSSFGESERNVRLTGEAFFDVVKNERQPFLVNLGKIGVKVLGTRFDVINYDDESQTEIVLKSGKVSLFERKGKKMHVITEIRPGQQAIYKRAENKLAIQDVDTEKYISWINGRLVFRDDPMDEVVRKLDRWFNVDIEFADPEISQYVYTATFQHENINQILELFKRTSPVEYQIKEAVSKQDGSFSKQKIILKKRIN